MSKLSTPWSNDLAGDISLIPLGRLVSLRKEKNDPIQLTQVLSLTASRGVILYEDKGDIGNQASDDIARYSVVRVGDIVINSMNVIIGSVGISRYEGVLSQVYYVLKANKNNLIDMQYLAYHFQIVSFQKSLTRIGYGILDHRMRIPWINLQAELIAVPTVEKQRDIVRYLDSQVPRINSLISLFHEQLRLSREAFQVLVEHKTSHQLNKGDEKITLRRIVRLDPITDIPKSQDALVTFLGLEDVQPGKLGNFGEFRNIGDVLSGYSRFKRGDILVPKVSPSFGHGRAVVVPDSVSEVGFASTEVYVLRCRNPRDAHYICASLRARDFLLQGESTYQGVAGVKRVDKEFILDWTIRWPKEHLRSEIANEIVEAQRKLELLEDFTEKAVSKLSELRSSIIFDAITKNGFIETKVS